MHNIPLPIPEIAASQAARLDPSLVDFIEPELCAAAGYAALTHDVNQVITPIRQVEALRHFAHDKVYREVLASMSLVGVGMSIDSELYGTNARKSLRVLADRQSKTEPDRYFNTLGLLTDMPVIGESAAVSRFDFETHPEALEDVLRTSERDTEVPPEYWSIPSRMPSSKQLESVLSEKQSGKGVNIEALVMRSVASIVELRESPWTGEKLLQQIFDAEAFFAPLVETVGFDGVAMALRSEAAHKRLYRMGKGAVYDRALNILGELLTSPGYVAGAVNEALQLISGGKALSVPLLGNDPSHGIVIGESVLTPPALQSAVRAVWRLKSPGSLAVKVLKHQTDYNCEEATALPADVIGITVIAPNKSAQAILFSDMMQRVLKLDSDEGSSLRLAISPSRKSEQTPFHIRGKKEDLNTMMAQVVAQVGPNAAYKLIDRRDDEDGFEVSKVTLTLHDNVTRRDLPIEIQYLTREARTKARNDIYAHAGHKGNREVNPKYMRRIWERIEQLDHMGLTMQSNARAEQLHEEIASIPLSSTASSAFTELQMVLRSTR